MMRNGSLEFFHDSLLVSEGIEDVKSGRRCWLTYRIRIVLNHFVPIGLVNCLV